jgi:hypothetical protein
MVPTSTTGSTIETDSTMATTSTMETGSTTASTTGMFTGSIIDEDSPAVDSDSDGDDSQDDDYMYNEYESMQYEYMGQYPQGQFIMKDGCGDNIAGQGRDIDNLIDDGNDYGGSVSDVRKPMKENNLLAITRELMETGNIDEKRQLMDEEGQSAMDEESRQARDKDRQLMDEEGQLLDKDVLPKKRQRNDDEMEDGELSTDSDELKYEDSKRPKMEEHTDNDEVCSFTFFTLD